MSRNIEELANKPVARLLWQYSLPAVIGMVVVSLYNVIDRIFIGQQVGPEAIAGLAITFPVMNLCTAFGVLVGGGASARVSILLGQNRRDEAERVLGNSLMLTLIIGTLYVGTFALFLDDILIAFGASAVTLPPAHDFMSTLLPGLLIMNLTMSFNNIQRSSGYPKRAMIAMIISAGINLVLAALFIFVFKLGIRGAALATVLAMTSALVFVMWHFFKKDVTIRFKRGIYGLKWRIVGPIFAIGAAPFLVNVAGCLVNVLINKSLSEYGGDTAVGAAGLFTTYTQLVVMVILGICQGMQPIVGFNFGAGKYGRMQKAYWLAVSVATVLCVLCTLGGLTIPRYVARLFTNHEGLIAMTESCLTKALLAFPLVGFQVVSTTFFQSTGKAAKSIVLGLARQVIFLIPMMLMLPHFWGLDGVWYSFPLSDFCATAVTALLVWHTLRQMRHLERNRGLVR